MTLTKPHTNFQKDWRPLRFHPLRCCFVLHAGIEVTGDSTEHTELSLVSLVRSGRVSTFFASTEPQEFNSDIDLHNGTRQCALGPILRPEIITLVFILFKIPKILPVMDPLSLPGTCQEVCRSSQVVSRCLRVNYWQDFGHKIRLPLRFFFPFRGSLVSSTPPGTCQEVSRGSQVVSRESGGDCNLHYMHKIQFSPRVS